MSTASVVCSHVLSFKVYIEMLADAANLSGAVVLARDAFGRKRELRDRQLLEAVATALPNVVFEPADRTLAVISVRWARWGVGLLIGGFSVQLLTRLLEFCGP